MARLQFQVNRTMGGNAEYADFLPRHEESDAASIDDIAKALGVKKVNR
jgi:hypothetical protein